jgi:hypothetical protein
MSRLYIVLLTTAAFLVSVIGATFSLVGLTQLFAGAPVSIGFMAGSLEFSKLVVAGFLYRYWGHVNKVMRTYMSTAVVILSIITSLGIFGYLSNAYQQSSFNLKTQMVKKDILKKQNDRIQTDITKIEKFIEEVPRNRISKKFAYYEQSRNQVNKLRKQSEALLSQIATLELNSLVTQKEVGPLIFVAEYLGIDVDVVARFLILIFVSVFDPLAICLVFAANLAVRIREKYKGNEVKIASLSVSKPVDHRYRRNKKAA